MSESEKLLSCELEIESQLKFNLGMGDTKKIRRFILTVENFSKSYFRKCPNYFS